ncbi:uncharacterized protein cubi_03598 [Cryptosporidium ubiquitum]|uniref:Uncharacterized protein n=1 Tax=Cryptosporidium ubiquitum TaxID=857276 RepID=A0A1J4MHT2_9CRYT|nr:uncharacterized protein cubi_03598 [Cryptosporidium ubiquitum]OII73801.1 hypothetical protein cubi_03598 [Cryptosporidium ubiquitum]
MIGGEHSIAEEHHDNISKDIQAFNTNDTSIVDNQNPNIVRRGGLSEANLQSSCSEQLSLGSDLRSGCNLFEKKSPKDEQLREKESKQALKSVMKLQNEIFNINNSIVSQENAYKNSLFSNKYMGNIFSSFSPFITGINKFTIRPRERSPEEVLKNIRKKSQEFQGRCEYIKYSTQWYLWAKRRNAEIFSQNHIGNAEQSSSNMSNVTGSSLSGGSSSANTSNNANSSVQNNIGQIFQSNQLILQKEIQNIEQSVKFRLALQSDKPLFTFNNNSRSNQLSV